jgi:hydroxymethylbilane synthase
LIALATRGSALALAQTQLAIAALGARFPGLELAPVVVDSDGDMSSATQAPDLPGQGWFTSRLERALSLGQVEGAVHSAKDLPTEMDAGLTVAAFLPRADPRDAIVVAGGLTWSQLPSGARVGTSSPRRATQLQAIRPDLEIVAMRGNIDTRVRLVREGELDACVIALAGLLRLSRSADGVALDPLLECTPAPAQGAIAIQARAGSQFAELARAVDDPVTRCCIEAERLVLTQMGGGCRLPLGTLAEPLAEDRARLTLAWSPDPGLGVRRLSREGRLDALPELALAMAKELR